jgi:RecG-like helicase
MKQRAASAPASAGRGGRWSRFNRTQEQVEAEELRDQVHGADLEGLTTIDCCTPGQTVTVRGMVRSVTMRPRSTVPALEIELYDGSGSVSVIWLGRRRIPGIDPGRTIVVHGRLTCNADDPTIYNPRYELKPATG